MVGICKIAKSGWLSGLNNIQVCETLLNYTHFDRLKCCQTFPMYAKDDRYASSFLFTEKEVDILCKSHNIVRTLVVHVLYIFILSL